MIINLSPSRRDKTLEVYVSGEVLTLNGLDLDLSVVPTGATVPADAVDSDWITGPIERDESGDLSLTLLLPYGPNAPHETKFPSPITITEDGPIELPPYTIEETSE